MRKSISEDFMEEIEDTPEAKKDMKASEVFSMRASEVMKS